MKKQLPKREELNVLETWNLGLLFQTEQDYEKALETLTKDVDQFVNQFYGKINNETNIIHSLKAYEQIRILLGLISNYQSLASSTDSISEVNQYRSSVCNNTFQKLSIKLNFFINEIYQNDNQVLFNVKELEPEYAVFIDEVIKNKKHRLSDDVEFALVSLSQSLNSNYRTYEMLKLADMKFANFDVHGTTYPNSFTLFENEYEYETNHEVRRKSYESFYSKLSEYQNGFASNYIAHVHKEKSLATLRGYNSVFDYLLASQNVDRSLMDRQIDLIMNNLAPAFRRYAKHLQEIHQLDEMTYADLKISVDSDFEAKIEIDQAKKLVKEGLSVLGKEYMQIVNEALDNRWIDFPQNEGKSTGGFCASPYGANSFILLNWNGQMDEVMVLAHELGHAGHFQYANKYQNLYNTNPSLYFIEAPSTTNELIMSLSLEKKAKTLREKRYIKSVMIARTYYHNFVTHLLEAAFQREVYELVDQGKPLSASILNNLKLNIIKKFWGDEINIPNYAGLTWMRQPHYFMGLYPYTYSAGLTIGTVVAKQILENQLDPKRWIEVLKAGGTKEALDLAKMVDLDLSTDEVLLKAIDFISQTIYDIITLTHQLN